MEDFVYIEKTEEMDMKVLLVNGSAKEHGCTDTALHEAAIKLFAKQRLKNKVNVDVLSG